MDKTVSAIVNGVERQLNYSVEIMFDVTDKFGDIQSALETLEQDNKAGFEAVRWFVVRMVNDAELCRRDAGYDHLSMLKEEDISPRMKPIDYELLKGSVVDAISVGYGREASSEDVERDIGLEELNQKKTKVSAGERS